MSTSRGTLGQAVEPIGRLAALATGSGLVVFIVWVHEHDSPRTLVLSYAVNERLREAKILGDWLTYLSVLAAIAGITLAGPTSPRRR